MAGQEGLEPSTLRFSPEQLSEYLPPALPTELLPCTMSSYCHNFSILLNLGRGGRSRTYANGFGDRHATITPLPHTTWYLSLLYLLIYSPASIWWVWSDSNWRPNPYQGFALTNWATDPNLVELDGIEPPTFIMCVHNNALTLSYNSKKSF